MSFLDWLSHRSSRRPCRTPQTHRANSWAALTRAWDRRQHVDRVVSEVDEMLREDRLADRIREALNPNEEAGSGD